MADEELKSYPGGQIQIGGGDLEEATSAKFSCKNNSKLGHTLKASPSGVIRGVLECTGSVEMMIPEDGQERDFASMVKTAKKSQFRYKFPKLNVTVNGVVDSADYDTTVGEGTKFTFTIIGKWTDT